MERHIPLSGTRGTKAKIQKWNVPIGFAHVKCKSERVLFGHVLECLFTVMDTHVTLKQLQINIIRSFRPVLVLFEPFCWMFLGF